MYPKIVKIKKKVQLTWQKKNQKTSPHTGPSKSYGSQNTVRQSNKVFYFVKVVKHNINLISLESP